MQAQLYFQPIEKKLDFYTLLLYISDLKLM